MSKPYQFLVNALKNRLGLPNALEIPATTEKEGQCDGEENLECELDVFKRENAEWIEQFNQVHTSYHSELKNAPTDYEEILIYEEFVEELYSIIFNLIRCSNIAEGTSNSAAHPSGITDLKQESNDPVINAMDSKPSSINHEFDNENETIEAVDEKPVNLRHKLNNNDLHNTCQKLQEELREEKIKNETMSLEIQRQKKLETYGETLSNVLKEEDTGLSLEARLDMSSAKVKSLQEDLKRKDEEMRKVRKPQTGDEIVSKIPRRTSSFSHSSLRGNAGKTTDQSSNPSSKVHSKSPWKL